MSTLNTLPNFSMPGATPLHAFTPGDDFYEALIQAHHGLSDDQSRLVNSRLILLLANHVGDLRVLQQALAAARAGVVGGPGGGQPATKLMGDEEPA